MSYLTDSEGNIVTRMDYTPYGEKVKSASSGPDIFHQKYTGQVDDGDDAELMYYNARYYDPKLGRFISADSIIPDPEYSQSFNRYMYVYGNPINFNDPSGHERGDNPGSQGRDNGGSDHGGGGASATGNGGRGGKAKDNYKLESYKVDKTIITSDNRVFTVSVTKFRKVKVNDSVNEANDGLGDTDNDTDNPGHGDGGEKPEKKFINPLDDDCMKVWSRWGWRYVKKPGQKVQEWIWNFHNGIDLGAPEGKPVYAVADGYVYLDDFTTKLYGRRIIIDHGDGLQTEYSHLSRFNVIIGKVKKGDIIGYTGNSGPKGTRKHLHFVVVLNGKSVDPESYLDLKN